MSWTSYEIYTDNWKLAHAIEQKDDHMKYLLAGLHNKIEDTLLALQHYFTHRYTPFIDFDS